MGFYIRPHSRYRYSVWTDNKTSSSRSRQAVNREAYIALGFNYEWTIEEAKDWAKRINKKEQHERRKIAAAAKRVQESELVHDIYLPPIWLKEFDRHLEDLAMGSESWLSKLRIHWNTARNLILDLEISPDTFKTSSPRIITYLLKKKYSVGYIKRLRYMLNQWGAFYSRQTKTYFEPIPALTSNQREKVIDAHEDKPNVRKPSVPLLWRDLKNKEYHFKNEGLEFHFNWMVIATWFGLRPIEVDSLLTEPGKYWRVEKSTEGHDELFVYQTKLKGIPKAERWKVIPVYFPEQVRALELIKNKEFKRPLVKTLVLHLGIEGVDTYSPRKAFTDLMLGFGFEIADIAIFMGHRDINQTWSAYKQKNTYNMPKQRRLKIAD